MSQILIPPSLWTNLLSKLAPRLQAIVWTTQGAVNVGIDTRYDARGSPLKITVTRTGTLTIGSGCFLNFGLDLYCANEITIGDHALIGPRVFITDSNAHYTYPQSPLKVAPVRIGKNVWIGHSAIILPGVHVGDHSIVAAGATVTKSVPSCSIVAGIPARVIRMFAVDHDSWIRNEHIE